MDKMNYITEESILYDPQTDTYKVKTGDKVVSISRQALQSENTKTLEEALRNVDDAYRKTYLGDWVDHTAVRGVTARAANEMADRAVAAKAAKVTAGMSAAEAPLDRIINAVRTKVRNATLDNLRSAAGTPAPWEDPAKLKQPVDDHGGVVACCDAPDGTYGSIYYHDRFPSIPIRSIIDDAIELLNTKMKLHVSKISFSQSHSDIRLAVSSRTSDKPGYVKTLEVLINHSVFDRSYKSWLDAGAGLRAKLDTNTYIKLRIAFLLYKTLKLSDDDAKKVSLAIFKVMGSYTRLDFTF